MEKIEKHFSNSLPEIELRRLGIEYTLSGNKNKPIEKVFNPLTWMTISIESLMML